MTKYVKRMRVMYVSTYKCKRTKTKKCFSLTVFRSLLQTLEITYVLLQIPILSFTAFYSFLLNEKRKKKIVRFYYVYVEYFSTREKETFLTIRKNTMNIHGRSKKVLRI